VEQGSTAPVYLLHGEPFLVKSALSQLTHRLIPEAQQNLNLREVDGSEADYGQLLDSLNTFTLFPGPKAVIVEDCRIFYSRANLPSVFAKSREAYDAGDLDRAARLLLEVLAYAGWSLADMAPGSWQDIPRQLWRRITGVDREQTQMDWLETVADYARSNQMEVPRRTDETSLLEAGLERGFPPQHHLLLTTDTVDKHRSLYRLIEQRGVVVDLTVASGTSRRARSQQEAVVKDLVQETLRHAGKQMESGALTLLLDRTGFNLWAAKTQVETLIAFVGADPLITRDHVAQMTDRVREEPLYELNNAVAERDCAASLALLHRLLDQGFHPLQLLSSLAKEIRRLLAAREFLDIHLSAGLDPGVSYNRFHTSVYPVIKTRAESHSLLSTLHPFVLHKTLMRCTSFEAEELIDSLQDLFVADMVLKSTGLSERMVMENLVMNLCRPRH
jgi:DNA polymerase-3 subunit delta